MVPRLLYPSACKDRRRTGKFRTSFIWRRNVSVSSTRIMGKRKSRHHRLQRSDWSNIAGELLELFQKKLPFADTLRCKAVCSRWRCVAQCLISSSLNSPPPTQLPPLLYHCIPPEFLDTATGRMDFYAPNSVFEKLLYSGLTYVAGFSHGWFLFYDGKKKNRLCLFHPLLSFAACLPPILTPKGFPPILNCKEPLYKQEFADKVVFSADPILSNGNFGIAVIHPSYQKILFAKSGATHFTDLDYQDVYVGGTEWKEWKDIICFQNHIYGIAFTHDEQHHMEAWDFSGECVSPVKVLDFQPKFSSGKGPSSRSSLYLVESQGELLLVSIKMPNISKMPDIIDGKRRVTFPELFVLTRSPKTIRVYKMDFAEMKWVQMESLGDRVLFIMEYQNFSLSSQEFPQYKSNTVYFKHHIFLSCYRRCCVGVFNMEDGSMEEIWPGDTADFTYVL